MSYGFKFLIKYYQETQMIFEVNNLQAEFPIEKLSLLPNDD